MIFFCGSFPSNVSSIRSRGSALPVTRIAWYTNALPLNGSLMAPPTQVDAPPKGSISVGWLCVSFLKSKYHSCFSPSTSTSISMVHAFISSVITRSSSFPLARRYLAAMVPISINEIGLCSRLSSFLNAKYLANTSSSLAAKSPANCMSFNSVKNVVCLQWSLQYVSSTLSSVSVGFLFSVLK